MKWFVCGAWLMMTAVVHAQGNSSAARDLTVRLFSTQPVISVTVEPKGASMRLCDACKQSPIASAVEVSTVTGHSDLLQVGLQSSRAVRFVGDLYVVTKDGRNASGAGKWVVKPGLDGLHVTLTIPSERYVMAVLQSEAGPDDGAETLKALAVVARSFALEHADRHGVEGLCDSTHCQAARMATVPARIRDAVLATAGETLWFGGKRADGYFTQNCGGQTADAREVWGGESEPWLRAHADPYCQRQPSQWHASITREALLRSLQEQGLQAPHTFEVLRIAAKDSSGRTAKLALEGPRDKVLIRASDLRFAVNRELGWNTIRSDWYTVHVDGQKVVFDGRGYGHGVGLCQAGAAEMSREGKRYREILAFYFMGAQVRVNAGDEGWRSEDETGWTLRSTYKDAEIVRTGNAAWADARSRWNPASEVRPIVTFAPDTELFRQITNEPGWALASTSGAQITLQPASVVKAHEGYKPLLLHEFLHALVEAEAGYSAPLWLREGLVETLAGERGEGRSSTAMTPAQIEGALQNARSLREAQQAHRAAGALVAKLVARFGLSSVRGWFRSGVPAGVLMSK